MLHTQTQIHGHTETQSNTHTDCDRKPQSFMGLTRLGNSKSLTRGKTRATYGAAESERERERGRERGKERGEGLLASECHIAYISICLCA